MNYLLVFTIAIKIGYQAQEENAFYIIVFHISVDIVTNGYPVFWIQRFLAQQLI